MRIDMDGGLDWPAIIQAVTAVVAVGLGLLTLWRDRSNRRATMREAVRTLMRIHNMASRVVDRVEIARTRANALDEQRARSLLHEGTLAELLALLDEAKVGDFPGEGSRAAFQSLRVLARDIEGRLRLQLDSGPGVLDTRPWRDELAGTGLIMLHDIERSRVQISMAQSLYPIREQARAAGLH